MVLIPSFLQSFIIIPASYEADAEMIQAFTCNSLSRLTMHKADRGLTYEVAPSSKVTLSLSGMQFLAVVTACSAIEPPILHGCC